MRIVSTLDGVKSTGRRFIEKRTRKKKR